MMDMLLLEDISCTGDLLPFTATRSVLDIRMGILTFREKWTLLLGADAFRLIEASGKRGGPESGSAAVGSGGPGDLSGGPAIVSDGRAALAANLLPTRALAARVREELARDGGRGQQQGLLTQASIDRISPHARLIRYPWHIFQYNAEALIEDFVTVTAGRTSSPIPSSVQAIMPEHIFIEEGARLQYCVLNASTGPIYIGRDAEIMEGALIRGPFAACEGSTVKMASKIYGATTLGPYTVAGGEIKNSVFFGYSNKGHDGYLGDAVLGEWCNLGAGCSASNLKNNAGEVKVYHPASKGFLNAGTKCGLLMGDYSRAAINTAFNTGTVVGVGCNIFGEGQPPKYIPDFSWGQDGQTRCQWDKVLRDIGNWKKLKNQQLTEKEILTLKHIFDQP